MIWKRKNRHVTTLKPFSFKKEIDQNQKVNRGILGKNRQQDSRYSGGCLMQYFSFLKDYIYLFLEKGEGKERGRETQCVVASCTSPMGDLACNPRMCPDWEWNRQPFGSQAHTQSTELHQPGLQIFVKLPIT